MMTDLAFISATRPPWLLMTQREISWQDVPDGMLLVEADAALMMNYESSLRELAAVFQFPDYFGKNYNALNDCITDLDWLPAEVYLFVIKNSARLKTFNNKHGNFEIRDSLLIGPSGKAIRLNSTFQIMPDGSRSFITTIPKR